MFLKIFDNIGNDEELLYAIDYVLGLDDVFNDSELMDMIKEVNSNNDVEFNLETNVYYPTIYRIEDNCPTCGYRTPESRRRYSEEYVVKVLEKKLGDIDLYPISGVNCYNKSITGINELVLLLNLLKNFDINVNISLSNVKQARNLERYDINSIIYREVPEKNSVNKKYDKNNEEVYDETLEFLRTNTKFNITYEFLINYGEDKIDILKKIRKIQKYNISSIEIKGYDPFIDSPEEYNPQYTKEYLMKIICILRIIFKDKELKIQYATNCNNYFKEYRKLGINTITGIYTSKINKKLENINQIINLIKIIKKK